MEWIIAPFRKQLRGPELQKKKSEVQDYITQSPDTSAAAEKVWIDLMRQASFARKFALVRSFSHTVMQLSWRALARANPKLPHRKIDILFVKLHYGPDLAERLEKYLANMAL